ncbi:hypothetical protein LEP1GSC050_0022 [Leptospira phage vB_LbrZ_5399-LE1]|uniref:Uncharacterized protein n=1 Tax=Leptospira inadai serovar Lyme TaxID=293084 RepID=A0ABX4YGA3_9LEPT|nr:hypothetical protein [Leptospira inadai]AGS80751.1 hypothetical protein LEP1GSC050_0022 [Leptospira phage vB_LbrZ_5399-LE1]AGS80818.1 hypothetical protein LEP1GSC047_0849 [Leptospira phage vB_LinZ_10-LE1]PNV74289.1 hypothetical protein BES34_013965 [Leptospira inadai serovar Lyme]
MKKFFAVLKKLLHFPSFVYRILSLPLILYYNALTLKVIPLNQVLVFQYDPKKEKNPEKLASRIEKSVIKPFRSIYQIEPIVLIWPLNEPIRTASLKGLIRGLNSKQRSAVQRELYAMRNNFENAS